MEDTDLYRALKNEDLHVAAFSGFGNDEVEGGFDPGMFTDRGVICIELDTKTKGINWDLYKKIFRGGVPDTTWDDIIRELEKNEALFQSFTRR